jgi:tRNA dimethylallyltransferase
LWDFFDGRRDWAATVRLIQQRSRNYAKRQLTWFRHLPECRPVTSQLTFAARKSTMN